MRVLTLVVMLAVVLGGARAVEPAESPTALLERAHQAYRQGRFLEALEAARGAAQGAPRSRDALLARGTMAEFMGEFDEAARAYGDAIALAPNDPALHYALASLAVRLGDYDRALRELDTIFKSQPWPAQLLFRYAPVSVQKRLMATNRVLAQLVQLQVDILMEKGDLGAARQTAWRYAIVEPGRDYCGQSKGPAASGVSRDERFTRLRLATLAQPTAGDCIWWYGQYLTDDGYMRLGRLIVTEALKHGDSEERKQPGYRYVRSRLAGGRDVPKRAESLFLAARQRYLRDGDVDGAERLLDEALRVAPSFVRPYTMKARIAQDAGNPDDALQWLRRGLEADPDSWRALHNLGRSLLELERWEESERALVKAVQLFPEDMEGRLRLARALYAQGKFDRYAAETRNALQIARGWSRGSAVAGAATFLEKFERWGPGAAPPPAPDVEPLLGYGQD